MTLAQPSRHSAVQGSVPQWCTTASRSHRTHGDLRLQLDCEATWDCYLAFLPFVPDIADTPLNEFRCYVSRGIVRCIAQYSYLVQCPIPADDMPEAGQACAAFVRPLLPSLPGGVEDVAIDVRCVPRGAGGFKVSLIEVNPLGPGCVWGTLYWDHHCDWLLGRCPPPFQIPSSTGDNEGNSTAYVLDSEREVVVAFTSSHARGFTMGGLSHMPAGFLMELHEAWGLGRLMDHHAGKEKDKSPPDSGRMCMLA